MFYDPSSSIWLIWQMFVVLRFETEMFVMMNYGNDGNDGVYGICLPQTKCIF